MMTDKNIRQQLTDLLCGISEPHRMEAILESILTPKELDEIENRIRIFQLLKEKVSQRDIANRLNVGIATVTRGAAALKASKFSDF